MTDSTDRDGDRRPRWHPERVLLTADEVPRARIEAAAPEGGVSPLLLGKASQLQQVAASLLVRRALLAQKVEVVTRMHSSGVVLLECGRGDDSRRGFVVASVSSMEPRPIWPTLIPLSVFDIAPLDWVGSCSVPKQPALDAIEERPADAYLLGWLDIDEVAQLPIVSVAAHLGHEFEAKYRQVKHHRLRPFSRWP